MAPKIGEEGWRFWDLIVKAGGVIAAVFTIWTGIRALDRQADQLEIQQEQLKLQQDQITSQQSEQSKAREEEYHRRFWERKLDRYLRQVVPSGRNSRIFPVRFP